MRALKAQLSKVQAQADTLAREKRDLLAKAGQQGRAAREVADVQKVGGVWCKTWFIR